MVAFMPGLGILAPKLKKSIKELSWGWPMPQANSSPLVPKITLSKSVEMANSLKKSKFKVMPSHWISTTELYSQVPNLVKF